MDSIQQQRMALLARKALLLDELKQIESTIGQLTAISQYLAANPTGEAPENSPEE